MVMALPAAEVAALFMRREVLLGRGLAVLAAWVLLNLIGSGYYLARADRRRETYYFHGLNVLWNLMNAGLAAWGILRLHFHPPAGLDAAELLSSQDFYEMLFGVNAGLDVLYVLAGNYLRGRAAWPDQSRPERLLGYGRALWVQGGFLLLFDASMWALLHWLASGWPQLLK
ncbi:hypothetical protein MON38_04760 [Hymenobacter sp. DH14]|uniref:Uncharacterized protein n=1 Tax=Hymenobacter cyanobacteriorum TaxID=2926463 RepID=A0A9X1VDR0_9BACT|nr:hypothetical protein [Hymenobacter cyanobacteriorum]MCI1186718.1 hypothetical protein [Hymenobacter cyanobacteriorum]